MIDGAPAGGLTLCVPERANGISGQRSQDCGQGGRKPHRRSGRSARADDSLRRRLPLLRRSEARRRGDGSRVARGENVFRLERFSGGTPHPGADDLREFLRRLLCTPLLPNSAGLFLLCPARLSLHASARLAPVDGYRERIPALVVSDLYTELLHDFDRQHRPALAGAYLDIIGRGTVLYFRA